MNPDFLPPLQVALRALGEFAARHDVNDSTLTEIATELDRARALVASARGNARANHCLRHLGGPVDPTAQNGCLLCGTAQRRPARPMPEGVRPVEVLRFLEEHGQDAATDRYGAQAVTRALALGDRHPSTQRPGFPAELPDDEGEL
ncbi:hypothetical protein ACFVW5_04945 [Streptomyces sp. NPDC058232]|uniref:hypothetical protein n=1 Tax=Streptomyces sp. NPDC058232 TaxID=3346393 RepID=UPI0036E01292